MVQNPSINSFHGDRFKFSMSNFPGSDNPNLISYFENYIKSVTIPDYSLKLITSSMPFGMKIRHPDTPNLNEGLTEMTVTFILSENMINYWMLFKWMNDIRYSQINSDDLVRKYTIKVINIDTLDNQKNKVASLKYTECFLTNLSSLNLQFGEGEQLTFNATFNYQEVTFDLV